MKQETTPEETLDLATWKSLVTQQWEEKVGRPWVDMGEEVEVATTNSFLTFDHKGE